MTIQTSSTLWPFSWWSAVDETDSFTKDLTSNIANFGRKLSIAFKDADATLQKQTIFVSYMYQTSLKDLNVRYYFTNQTQDWPANESNYNKLFVSRAISKEIPYAELDEETHQKIADFIQKTKALFPENFAGIRFEDSPNSTNLSKVIFVAQTQFDYLSKTTSAEVSAKLRSFAELTNLLESQLDKIIKKQASTLKIPVENPFRASSICLKKVSPNKNLSPIQRVNPTAPQKEYDPLPFSSVLETNLKATQLLAKQPLFNVLFEETKSAYPQQFSFDMRDGDLQFDVTYQLNGSQFVGTFPSVVSTNFNVEKEYQESQRRYCAENSAIIQPKGTLSLKQNDLAYCMQYIVQAGWSIAEDATQMQDTLNSFNANRNSLQVL